MSVSSLFDLSGRVALVTGGSRGLGLQLAHALGEAGAKIMLSSRKASDLEEATAELQAAGIDARWIAADCAQEDDIREEKRGGGTVQVNHTGAQALLDGTPGVRRMRLDLPGLRQARALFELLRERKGGEVGTQAIIAAYAP